MYKNGVTLRDYQQDVKSRLFEAWQHERSVMVQMPTGTGKTHVLAAVIKDFLQDNAQNPQAEVWIIAHRRELVVQIEETVAKYGICKDDGWIRVMSIQWLVRHWDDVGGTPLLIVIDEAHHALADSYKELWKRYPDARKLGMTATPCRMNHKGFTYLFDVLVTSWSIAEFIEKGYLSAFDYVSIKQGSDEQRLIGLLEKRGADGDYQIKEMDSLLNRDTSICRLYGSMARFAAGKKGIVYAISIEHARRIAEYYSSQGVVAVSIDSETPIAERKQMVEDFKAGKIKVLVNVDVFSEGFDCPDVEFVQMARPTLSLSKYLQQVGRGLRKSEGKETCVLIDNVGLYRVFGLPTVACDWNLMFHGEVSGKGMRTAERQNNRNVPDISVGEVRQDCDMEVIVSHSGLLPVIEKQKEIERLSLPEAQEIKVWQDKCTGLWGLMAGRRKITEAVFMTVFDIQYGMAAVRYRDNHCDLISSLGESLGLKKHYRSMKFAKKHFLIVQRADGKSSFIDLYNLKEYSEKPQVKCFGNIEMLKIRSTYYSRTKNRYVNNRNINDNYIRDCKFYVQIFDCQIPDYYYVGKSYEKGYRCGYVCLFSGDYETFYWIYSKLADGSIIVTDSKGMCYHAVAGKGRKYIGCFDSDTAGERCLAEIHRITKHADDTCRLMEQRKKREILDLSDAAVPFRSGMRWGLRVGERITVPPIYRNVKSPVGRYCAVEKNYGQWGVIALDGTLMVEPRYSDIEINIQGIVTGTKITGSKVSVKLP